MSVFEKDVYVGEMSVLKRCLYWRDVCIGEMAVLEIDIFIREMSVLERCLYREMSIY